MTKLLLVAACMFGTWIALHFLPETFHSALFHLGANQTYGVSLSMIGVAIIGIVSFRMIK